MEEVFTGVRQGDGSELGHHDAVVLVVGLVAVTGQETAPVRHPAFGYFELVQKSHAIEPVVEPGQMNRKTFRLRESTVSFWKQCDPLLQLTSDFHTQTSPGRF